MDPQSELEVILTYLNSPDPETIELGYSLLENNKLFIKHADNVMINSSFTLQDLYMLRPYEDDLIIPREYSINKLNFSKKFCKAPTSWPPLSASFKVRTVLNSLYRQLAYWSIDEIKTVHNTIILGCVYFNSQAELIRRIIVNSPKYSKYINIDIEVPTLFPCYRCFYKSWYTKVSVFSLDNFCDSFKVKSVNLMNILNKPLPINISEKDGPYNYTVIMDDWALSALILYYIIHSI